MAKLVTMPKLSDTMEEGGVAEWLKNVGDEVEEGEPLVEIETDKATMEYGSPYEGVLLAQLIDAKNTAPLNTPLAVIGDAGEKYSIDELVGAESGAAPESPAKEAAVKESVVEVSAPAPVVEPQPSGDRIRISPLAKKMAQTKGVDYTSIAGSGPHGRIIADDVKEFQAPGIAVKKQDHKIPHTMMRKTIAKRLLIGKNEAPHFYLTVTANMGAMMTWRSQLNEDPLVAKGKVPKVSVNDLVMTAVAKALCLHPRVNASWQDDGILEFGNVDVCMAVALPTGLVTPVIKDADTLGVRKMAEMTKKMGQKAKDGELTPQDYTGGSFTVSNLGMTQIENFTAIINPPQAAILAVGTIKQVPDVLDGEIRVASKMQMTMSCDHRVIDGMVGAQFLGTLKSFLENPLLMLS